MHVRKCERIALIGATGSIGESVLDICTRFPEKFEIKALTAQNNEEKLLKIAKKFNVNKICLTDPIDGKFNVPGYECFVGADSLEDIVSDSDIDQVVFASAGVSAIKALQVALKLDKNISLANKESIVVAGPWVMPLVSRKDQLRPIDSEHNAIWQCIKNEDYAEIKKIYLTASGGPFRNYSLNKMKRIRAEDALNHPTWKMGAKVTIDSATLMNKGIECIEAMQLFNLSADKVGAVIHPDSLVHGMILFTDGTIKMHLSCPDMRIPIASAMSWPKRLNLIDVGITSPILNENPLSFRDIDKNKFPCFQLALDAAVAGGAYPALLIGADEIAVNSFLEGEIPFLAIPTIIESTLSKWKGTHPSSLEDAVELVKVGQRIASELIQKWRTVY